MHLAIQKKDHAISIVLGGLEFVICNNEYVHSINSNGKFLDVNIADIYFAIIYCKKTMP